MVIVDSDLQLRKSAHTVSGITSLGGAITATVTSESVGDVFDTVTNAELTGSVVGEYECRCVYIYNNNPSNETMQGVLVYIDTNTAAPFTDIDIGLDPAGVSGTAQTITNENSIPIGIFFSFARGESNALVVGNIPKGQGYPLWIRRHAGPAPSTSSYPSDNYRLGFKILKSGNTPGPQPPSGNDQFGVRMIYPTNSASGVSSPYFMNMTDPLGDCRLMPTLALSKNADGSYAMSGSGARIRMSISDVPGCDRETIYNATLDTYDHSAFAQRGYMFQSNDWKNVEVTGYFKVASVASATTNRKLYLYSRTMRHNTSVGGGCAGCAYKGVIYGSDQVLKWHKESFHAGAEPCSDRSIEQFSTGVPRTDNNTWFGMKLMMWNFTNPSTNQTNVHLELWLDLNANNTWIKYGERNDSGGWYPGAPSTTCDGHIYCGGIRDQIITWGGPFSEIRWDGDYTTVHFKWLSCREIVPPSS